MCLRFPGRTSSTRKIDGYVAISELPEPFRNERGNTTGGAIELIFEFVIAAKRVSLQQRGNCVRRKKCLAINEQIFEILGFHDWTRGIARANRDRVLGTRDRRLAT